VTRSRTEALAGVAELLGREQRRREVASLEQEFGAPKLGEGLTIPAPRP
jgi:hypothetical protein